MTRPPAMSAGRPVKNLVKAQEFLLLAFQEATDLQRSGTSPCRCSSVMLGAVRTFPPTSAKAAGRNLRLIAVPALAATQD